MNILWNKYVQHIYYIGNEFSEDIQTYFLKHDINKSIITFIKYNTNTQFNKLSNFKKEALIRALKDAYINNYFNVLVLTDDIKFNGINNIEEVLLSIKGDMYIVNKGDICEDCIIFNRKAINYINKIEINFTNKKWYKNFEEDIKTNLVINYSNIELCHHKIDYVITYVNPNDEKWKALHEKTNKVLNSKYDTENRYRDWKILAYNFRSVEKYMPWINNIYLVVWETSQVPEWINIDNVKIVTHKDIIPSKFLPTYNSCTIEMFLPFIPGLSEYWIYANDDTLTVNTCKKTDMFIDGKCVLALDNIPNNKTIYYKQCINSFRFVMKEFSNIHIEELKKIDPKYKKFLHCAHPFLKSTGIHLHNLYVNEIYNTITKFRNEKNINQYVFGIYEYLTNNFKKLSINQTYITVNKINKNYVIEENNNLICFNDTLDNNNNTSFNDLQQILNTNLYCKFYKKSKYELNSYNIEEDTNIYKLNLHGKTTYSQNYEVDKSYIRGLVSIILSVYNCEKYIRKCIDSVLNQTYSNIELIIINDGSTDKTLDIIKSYEDKRIVLIDKLNSGVSDSRNIGINIAKGEYITFIDGDDWYMPNRIEVCLDAMLKYNVKIIQNRALLYSNDTTPLYPWEWPADVYNIEDKRILSTPKYDIGHSWSKVFDARLIKENSIYFPQCDFCEDTLFAIQAYTYAGKLAIIEDILSCYRREAHNTLSTTNRSPSRKYDLILSANEIFDKLKCVENFKHFKSIANKFILNCARNCV